PLQETQFQSPARCSTGGWYLSRSPGDGGTSIISGANRCRVYRLRKGKSWKDQFRIGRQRIGCPRECRALQDDGRRKYGARRLSRAASPMPLSPAEFAKLIGEETQKWGKVIWTANISME